MNNIKSLTLTLALFTLAAGAAVDPTKPSAEMSDVLKAQLAEEKGMRLKALVVGADGEGVALIGADAAQAAAVRRGSTLAAVVGGVRVEATVESVGVDGVFLAASGGRTATLAGTYTPLAAPKETPAEFLRYLESEKVPLSRLMRLISDRTGVNIAASDATAEKPVSIFLRNVTALAAVEEICRATGLWFRREPGGGVIRITTMAEYTDSLDTFREETTETFTLLYPNVIEVAGVIYGLYPDRTLLSLGEEEFDEDDEYDLSRRFRRFQVLEENGNSQFMEMQSPRVSSVGSRSGTGNFSYSRGNAISHLTQFDQLKERFRRGGYSGRDTLNAEQAKFIDMAAIMNQTNLVDAARRQASLANVNIFVTLSRRNNKLIVRTSDVKVMDEIRKLVKEMDVPTPMVLMEVKVLELELSDDFNAGVKWTLLDHGEASGVNTHTLGNLGEHGSNGTGVKNLLAQTLTSGQSTIDPTFKFQIVSDYVKSEIELMQKDGKVTTLATPTLLTANNEVSRIFNGSQRPIVTSVKSETIMVEGVSKTVPATEFEWKDVGTMLLITPNINSDKTVTLRLLQEESQQLENAGTVPIVLSGSESENGSVKEQALQSISSRSLTGTFVAKDGMTVMAGGLISETDKVTYWRTPFLGSIPGLGWLFRGTDKEKVRKEMIVLITPHVISTPMEGGKISEELMKALSDHPAADGRKNMGVFRRGEDPTAKEHSVKDDLENLVN